MSEDENIVKRVCRELGITQRELAEIIGNSEATIHSAIAKAKI
ncbi:winged helix-turn-helix transcriptional regulator [Campylobacter hyointestinalis]|uniref:Uncharacterized protein n=1 Tax=Campylobacter hyointestinalis subsp. hyointestinalis TaxID=91352 RepID=A0A9W5APN8_CAMHY|nr:winged helix-turn-helix transcriptional regulator [Campylobacter hyointestinalis]CUU74114.1 Uncharacterised protein [Campylobacter hyointestinalis subsp. hyointestinalis]CUU81928.1 Uncharacterised protein [Campylobacter hyointestinalis subsp. hyointestinalis]